MNYEAVPLDFALLERLPDRGLLGGVHWKGRRAVDLVAEINEAEPEAHLTSSQVQSRLRSMHVWEFVEPHPSVGASGLKIWSRTPKGAELLGRKEEMLR